jgi:RND family efflux transporter MFP subunit
MRRLVRTLLLVSLVPLGAGCTKKPPPPRPQTVVTSQPIARQINEWDDYVGRFEATGSVDVRPRVSGYIQSIGFTDGQIVRRGQVLFVIDPRPYQAALDQAKGQESRAEATVRDAKVELTRSRALLAARATSQQDLDTRTATELQAEADLAAAKAAVATAALNLGFTKVTAPIDGRVSDARITLGNLVTQDSSLLTNIVTLDPIRFAFQASESRLLSYLRTHPAGHGGASVQIRLQDEPDYRWDGRVTFVDNAVDTGSGTIRGYALTPNRGLFLKPGMFGHMRLKTAQPRQALLVPDAAVITDMTRQLVYVVSSSGEVGQRVVQLGPLLQGLRVINAGLLPTDRVIISGMQRAHPGDRVSAIAGQITALPDTGAQTSVSPPPGSATFAP